MFKIIQTYLLQLTVNVQNNPNISASAHRPMLIVHSRTSTLNNTNYRLNYMITVISLFIYK